MEDIVIDINNKLKNELYEIDIRSGEHCNLILKTYCTFAEDPKFELKIQNIKVEDKIKQIRSGINDICVKINQIKKDNEGIKTEINKVENEDKDVEKQLEELLKKAGIEDKKLEDEKLEEDEEEIDSSKLMEELKKLELKAKEEKKKEKKKKNREKKNEINEKNLLY